MKKNKRQNIILVAIAIIIIGIIAGYNYSVDQTKQKGLEFGNELQNIQEEVKQIQVEFNSKITQWEEGDLTLDKLLDYSKSHFQKLETTIERYDSLSPPELFSSSVELFKLSTQSQLKSDKEFTEWIRNNQESNKIRSDSLLQESFEYEMRALSEFNAAKSGVKEYDTPGKFEAPKPDISAKVDKIWENMKENCNQEYEQTGSNNQVDLEECLSESDKWKSEHLP